MFIDACQSWLSRLRRSADVVLADVGTIKAKKKKEKAPKSNKHLNLKRHRRIPIPGVQRLLPEDATFLWGQVKPDPAGCDATV